MYRDLILHPSPWALLSGLVLGVAASLVHYRLVEHSIRNVIERQNKAMASLLAGAMLRIALLAMPLLAGMIIPRYLSVFTAFLGLRSVKLYLFFREMINLRRR